MYFFSFTPEFLVKDRISRRTLISGPSNNGLYSLSAIPSSSPFPQASLAEKASSACWHQRLGHPHLRVLRQIINFNNLPCSTNKLDSLCTACQLGKSSRLSLSKSSNSSPHVLELIFSDVRGPALVLSSNGHR